MASIKDLKRMCSACHDCERCPMTRRYLCTPENLPDNADELVDKWISEHPAKTYAMDFFEKFPNARKRTSGVPIVCWKCVYRDGESCDYNDCTECWNREMEEV